MNKLMYFGAESYCAACRALKPIVEKEAPEVGYEVVFFDVDSDEGADEAARWKVKGLPTLVVVNEDGEEIQRAVGSTAWREIK